MRKGRKKEGVAASAVAKKNQNAGQWDSAAMSPHSIELEVRRRLLADPQFKFSSLVVRRMREGVCLEGMVETEDECSTIICVAREVTGVTNVINRLLVREPSKTCEEILRVDGPETRDIDVESLPSNA